MATPIVRQVVKELRGLLEHVEGDGCDPEMEQRLRILIGKLEGKHQEAAPRRGCRLVIERNIAPADLWHWAVLLPSGHMFAVSKRSFDSPDSCAYDALCLGVTALMQAEKAVEPRAPEGQELKI